MKATQMSRAETIHQLVLRAVTDFSSDRILSETLEYEEVFAKNFVVLRNIKGERTSNLQDLKQIFEDFRKQLKFYSSEEAFNCTPVSRSFSPNKETAIFIDELTLTSTGANSPDPSFRIFAVLCNFENGWKITTLEFSKLEPLVSEGDLVQKKLAERNKELEGLIEKHSAALNEASEKLEAIQAQLLRQEKLASLGQLTAGIAHEIKNPLNFINNFSELSSEFLVEIEENIQKLEKNDITEEIKMLLNDVKANMDKIHQHGTRADGIVKSMLLHSRGGSGKMEDIDLNHLVKEYVNLSFHGMRANKNPINVDIQVDTDESLRPVKLNPENFSRVILNLCKNAFDAMREKLEQKEKSDYLPKLVVRTKSVDDKVLLEIEDNGPGIPENIREKMMLPFFTTKKGSDGTGLGLSISQEIIKDHKGALEIETEEGLYTKFTIVLNRRN